MNDSPKASLPLDDNVRNAHLTAECRKEDDELNRVDIVCNYDKGCLLGLDQRNNVIQSVFRIYRFLCVLQWGSTRFDSQSVTGPCLLRVLTLGDGLGGSSETSLLLLLGLGAVLVKELE